MRDWGWPGCHKTELHDEETHLSACCEHLSASMCGACECKYKWSYTLKFCKQPSCLNCTICVCVLLLPIGLVPNIPE